MSQRELLHKALLIAARNNDIPSFDLIRSKIGNDNWPEFINSKFVGNDKGELKGKTALHFAAIKGCLPFIKKLLDHGADINAQCDEGETPTHDALQHLQFEAAKLLVERGANPQLQNSHGSNLFNFILNSNAPSEYKTLFDPLAQNLYKILAEERISHDAVYISESGNIVFLNNETEIVNAAKATKGKIAFFRNDTGEICSPRTSQLAAATETLNFKLPPLIFAGHHNDQACLDFIADHQNLLASLGYTIFCFEYKNNKTLEECMAELALVEQLSDGDEKYIAKINREFLEKIQRENHFQFQAIDTFGEIAVRDNFMANNLLAAAKQAQGGVIALVGSAHHGITKDLANKLGIEVKKFALCLNRDIEKVGLDSPLGIFLRENLVYSDSLILPISSNPEAACLALSEYVCQFMKQHASTVVYNLKITQTQLLRKLQDRLESCIGGQREDYIVDALVPSNDDNLVESALTLYKSYGVRPSLIKSSFPDETATLALQISEINGGPNSQLIAKAQI